MSVAILVRWISICSGGAVIPLQVIGCPHQVDHAPITVTVDTYCYWGPSRQIEEVSGLGEIDEARNILQSVRGKNEKGLTASPPTPFASIFVHPAMEKAPARLT